MSRTDKQHICQCFSPHLISTSALENLLFLIDVTIIETSVSNKGGFSQRRLDLGRPGEFPSLIYTTISYTFHDSMPF